MDSIILALIGVALAVVPAVGYYMLDVIKLHRVKVANEIRRAEMEARAHRLSEAVSTAVKSTSQTVLAGKRGAEGGLSPEVAVVAKETARQTAQKLLSPEDLRAVREQYQDEAAVNQLLDPLIEAAVHDTKQGATPPPKKETQ